MTLPLLSRIRSGVLVLAVYWLLLFIATHIPGPRLPVPLNLWDKAQHFGAYLILAVLVSIVVSQTRWSSARRYWTVLAVVVVYGALDELLQTLVPMRQADFLDFVADVLGGAAGIAAHAMVVRLLARRSFGPNEPDVNRGQKFGVGGR